jgi:hypothetical protein
MSLTAGTRLGPYEILVPIGAGGMGEVYRARDARLNRVVAIKVLPEAFASDPDRLRRFQTEAEALGALNHPGLLAIFDVGTAGEIRFIVSEYLEGRTLRDVIPAGGLPPRRVADYARQLASALAAAHERGIVHRDLKPENIFVTHDDRVKILDFGLAKDVTPRSTDATTAAEGTAQGMVLGTAGYMSPEQVTGGAVDARSDLFSTGAVLYEMLSGRRAFAGSSVVETLNAILKDDPADLDERVGRALPGLPAIVSRCLAKTPRLRFQSASDLSFAIETLAAPSGSSKALPAAAPARALRAWRLAAIVAGALLIATVAAFLWRGSGRPTVLSYTRLTLQTVTVFNARFAPDGETVVYSAAKEGHHPDLYVQRRQAPEAQRLNVSGAHVLSISSKGEIALLTHAQFIRHRWFRGTLARMPLEGTAPREVLADVTEADWSPDGSELAIVHLVGGEQRIEFPIGRVRYTTTGRITDLRLSPRDDRIAFLEHPAGVDDRGHVAAIDLDGHKTVLTPEFPGEDGLAWAPDGSEVYPTAHRAGCDPRRCAPDARRIRGLSLAIRRVSAR